MEAGKAEEALAALRQGGGEAAGRGGRALRSRRRAVRAVALRRGGAGVPARDRGQDAALKAAAFCSLGNALLQEGEVQGRGRGLQARAGAASRRPGGQVEPGDRAAKKKEEEKKEQENKDKDKDKDKDKQDDKDKKDDQSKQDKDKDKQDKKDEQDKKDKDKQGQAGRAGAGQAGQEGQAGQARPAATEARRRGQGAADSRRCSKNLEGNPKDLEKERARLRAVRRGRPVRDW